MPPRRSRATRRAPRKMRRNRPYGNKRKGLRQPIQYFKRSVYLQDSITIPAGAGSFVGASRLFQLNNLPNVNEFTSLYDQYQIKGVKLQLLPKWTENLQSSTSQTSYAVGRVASVIDYDDNGLPGSMDELSQYQNFKLTNGVRTHSRYLKPKVLLFADGTGGNVNVVKAGSWIDCGFPAARHLGLKFGFIGSGVAQVWDVRMTFYLAFKNVR